VLLPQLAGINLLEEKMKLDIEYVKAELKRRNGQRQLTLVSVGCGVNLRTARRIMAGANTRTETLEALQVYLRNTEKMKKLPDARKTEGC
jgi:hypothetical protein